MKITPALKNQIESDIALCESYTEINGSEKIYAELVARYSVIGDQFKSNLSTSGKIAAMSTEFDYRPELKAIASKLRMYLIVGEHTSHTQNNTAQKQVDDFPQRENGMMDSLDKDSEDWKKVLRSLFIIGMTGTPQERMQACMDVGYYYLGFAPASLYKYYSDEKLETVKSNKMWYSAPCKFNDVFDSDISTNENELFESVLQMNPDERGIRKGSLMWRQLKEQTHRQLCSLRSDIELLRTQMGIACLSESDDSLLMWAHYGNNHKGMCVEYELMEINRQLGFSPVPIVYSDDRACFRSLDPKSLERDVQGVFIESITSKSKEWSYEKEWRIIRDEVACGGKWDANKKGALLDMIRPRSVILGCEATPKFEKEVREYCESNEINLYKMEKDKALYRLNKVPIIQFTDSNGDFL